MATTTYTIRDYTVVLETGESVPEIQITAKDKTKSSYAAMPTDAELRDIQGGVKDIRLNNAFADCVNLVVPPTIPEYTARRIYANGMFARCTSLSGRLCIMATIYLSTQAKMFNGVNHYVFLYGDGNVSEIVTHEASQYIQLYVPPSPAPAWATPVINRTAGSRTNYVDMNRIAGNTYVLGGHPIKCDYANTDFAKDYEWQAIIEDANTMADTLGVQKVTTSTTYANLNKIENIHKLYHESQSE